MHSLIKLDVVSGVSFRGVATRLKELAHTQFYRKELVYYDFAARIKACEAARRGEPRGAAEEGGVRRSGLATPPPSETSR